MEEVIETTHLEFDKSAFLIDLIKHNNGALYIEINQTIYANSKSSNSIKINPSILTDIISVLQNYQHKLTNKKDPKSSKLMEDDKLKIQNRYLRGISIKELSMQIGKPKNIIEQVLRNRGIELVSNKSSFKRRWRKK